MERKNNLNGEIASNHTFYDYIKFVLTIGVIIGLGLFCLNQFLDYRFKAQFLGGPCELCIELNKHLEPCIKDASIIYTDKYTGEKISVEEYEVLRKKEIEKLINGSNFIFLE